MVTAAETSNLTSLLMDREGLLPRWKESATGLYPESGYEPGFETSTHTTLTYCDVFGRMPPLLCNRKLDTPVVAMQPKVKHLHGYARE
jgi:hypothetical protein